jgi:hypothetical protein
VRVRDLQQFVGTSVDLCDLLENLSQALRGAGFLSVCMMGPSVRCARDSAWSTLYITKEVNKCRWPISRLWWSAMRG